MDRAVVLRLARSSGGGKTVLVVNGVDAASGDYLLPPLSEHQLAAAALDASPERRTTAALMERHRRRTEDHLAPRFGVDETDLAQAGWGVVLAAGADEAVLAALRPLLDLRCEQAGVHSERLYRELVGQDGYLPGESKDDFLVRHGAGPGPVRPEVLPYYLLLVGGPEEIPFDVQYQLGVQHAVGRLAFDRPERYAQYAANVVAHARLQARARSDPVRLSVFAPRTDGDVATELGCDQLARPVAEAFEAEDGWVVTRLLAQQALKGPLLDHLSGPDRPDLLLTVSHGVGLRAGEPRQRAVQGGLLCQDWPGPGTGPTTPEMVLTASDLDARPELDLTGVVVVCFACFGAGTPRHDGFLWSDAQPAELAPEPFVAALPQAMLGRPHGALAVVGHVDRAWSCSFSWPGAGAQTEVFRSLLARTGHGDPLGAAMSYLTDRYAEVATELAEVTAQARLGRRVRDEQVAGLWTACADARDFVVLGDPAVSLGRGPAGGAARVT